MAVAEPIAGVQARPSRWERTWKSVSIVFESRVATVGLIMVLFWVIVGFISLIWTPYPPNESLFAQNQPPNGTFIISFLLAFAGVLLLLLSRFNRTIKIGGSVVLVLVEAIVAWWLLNGDSPNLLGTDNLGRDITSRLMTGTQVILLKTRMPGATGANYAILLAVLASLFTLPSLINVIGAWLATRRLQKLVGLVVVWAAAIVILFVAVDNLQAWMLFAVVLGGSYLLFFLYGWVKAPALKLNRTVRIWNIGLLVLAVLVALSAVLQDVTVPNFSLPIGVAIWGVIGSLIVGSIMGLNAGYRGGWWDQSIMQGLDALIAFPVIVLYLVVISALGRGDLVVILAITVTGAPGVARLVRSLALDIKTRDYIRAAETRGESKGYVMFREILPNARGPILVDAMLRVGYAIFAIGTLGFLGIGLPPPDPDWGSMVNQARQFIFSNQWSVVWPALAIASLVIGLNLFADGLREELTRYQK